MSTFDIIISYKSAIANGLLITLEMCLIAWSTGIIIGTVIGVLGTYYKKEVGVPSRIISFILGGIPILVLMFWLHFPLQEMLHLVVDPFITATLTLSIINIFLVADLVRGVMSDFPEQYVIAAKVCGMSSVEIVKKVQIPIIFRQIIPGVLNAQVNVLQLSLFASLISVSEIFRVAQQINSLVYRPVEIYTALAIFFLAICLPLNGLALYLRSKYTRNLSEK